jgi:uncharacterized protein (TIGR02594 family)
MIENNVAMLSRRAFLTSLSCLGAISAFELEGLAEERKLPESIGVSADYDGPLLPSPGKTLGNRPPRNAEERIAKAIILKAPVGPTPIDVAEYFVAIAKGEYGKSWQPYAQGWPIRWNPVIVNLFQVTGTKPEGDLTPWCAAFVNWCFHRSGKGFATRSASSGSFRAFGAETSTPRIGDIVVFRRTNPDGQNDRRGHVGFFVADHGIEVEVLGGNQIDRHDGCHMVSSKLLAKAGGVLTLHSYRTDKSLH